MRTRADSRRQNGRLIVAVIVWSSGAIIALAGNWLHWFWLVQPTAGNFPNQVWGDQDIRLLENMVAAIDVLLGAAVLLLWQRTGASRRGIDPIDQLVRLETWGTVARWLTVLFTTGVLVWLAAVIRASTLDWWYAFPGPLGQAFAQFLVLAGALLLPRFRRHIASDYLHRNRAPVLVGVLVVVTALVLPVPTATIFDVTQSRGSDQKAPAEPPTVVRVSEQQVPTRSSVLVASRADEILWTHTWRGAHEPTLIPPAPTSGTVLVQLTQATPSRPELALLSKANGTVLSLLNSDEIAALGVELEWSPELGEFGFSSGNVLLISGVQGEWVSFDGRLMHGSELDMQRYGDARLVRTNGLHARNLVDGTTWFIGDTSGCRRRLAVVDEEPVLVSNGLLVMYQECFGTGNDPSWATPEALKATAVPPSFTLFGLNSENGEVMWIAPLDPETGPKQLTTGAKPDQLIVTNGVSTVRLNLQTGEVVS